MVAIRIRTSAETPFTAKLRSSNRSTDRVNKLEVPQTKQVGVKSHFQSGKRFETLKTLLDLAIIRTTTKRGSPKRVIKFVERLGLSWDPNQLNQFRVKPTSLKEAKGRIETFETMYWDFRDSIMFRGETFKIENAQKIELAEQAFKELKAAVYADKYLTYPTPPFGEPPKPLAESLGEFGGKIKKQLFNKLANAFKRESLTAVKRNGARRSTAPIPPRRYAHTHIYSTSPHRTVYTPTSSCETMYEVLLTGCESTLFRGTREQCVIFKRNKERGDRTAQYYNMYSIAPSGKAQEFRDSNEWGVNYTGHRRTAEQWGLDS